MMLCYYVAKEILRMYVKLLISVDLFQSQELFKAESFLQLVAEGQVREVTAWEGLDAPMLLWRWRRSGGKECEKTLRAERPPADGQQGSRDFSPTAARHWILPTIWIASPKPPVKSLVWPTRLFWPSETLSIEPSQVCWTSDPQNPETINWCFFKMLNL